MQQLNSLAIEIATQPSTHDANQDIVENKQEGAVAAVIVPGSTA